METGIGSARVRFLLLGLIITLLVALVVVPLFIGRRTDAIRTHLLEVVFPAHDALLESQVILSAELAAARGYELTGDTMFLNRLRRILTRETEPASRLDQLSPLLDSEIVRAVEDFENRKAAWLAQAAQLLDGSITREVLVDSIMIGQRRFEAALIAGDHANSVFNRAEVTLTNQIESAERLEEILVFIISLAALSVAVIVGWLMHRLNRSDRERERLLESERSARMETEAALKTRDRVLQIVSHDLKNPLHTIGMAASILEMQVPQEQRKRQIEIIHRTVERANRMVMDLLDAARIESGRAVAIEPEVVPLAPLVEDAVDAFRLQADERHQQLTCYSEDGATVYADPDRIQQVLSNLIGNAVKFTPDGGRISVSSQPVEHGVAFSVADTGRGIAPELLPDLFEPFSQAEDTAKLGTGLGLSIASGLVPAHGGRISVESRPGEGSIFRFTLPSEPPADGSSARQSSASQSS